MPKYRVKIKLDNPVKNTSQDLEVVVESNSAQMAKADAKFELIKSAYRTCCEDSKEMQSLAEKYFDGDLKKAKEEVSAGMSWDFINNSKILSVEEC